MEHLEGVPLEQYIAGKSLEIETVLSLGIEIADALILPTLSVSSIGTSSLPTSSSQSAE